MLHCHPISGTTFYRNTLYSVDGSKLNSKIIFLNSASNRISELEQSSAFGKFDKKLSWQKAVPECVFVCSISIRFPHSEFHIQTKNGWHTVGDVCHRRFHIRSCAQNIQNKLCTYECIRTKSIWPNDLMSNSEQTYIWYEFIVAWK